MEYREIREYITTVYSIMTCFTHYVEEKNGKRKIIDCFCADIKEVVKEVRDINMLQVSHDFKMWAAETPTERLKVMLLDLLGVNAPFTDALINDFYNKYYVKGKGWITGIFVKNQAGIVDDMVPFIGDFLILLRSDLHLICCEHKIEVEMKKELEDFFQKVYVSDGARLTANTIFSYVPMKPHVQHVEVKRSAGRPRKSPELTVYQTCLYLRHILGEEEKEGLFGCSLSVTARILSKICGGEYSGFENVLRATRRDFWEMESSKEKKEEMTEKIAEIEEIINKKES